MPSRDLESRVTALEREVRDLAGRVRASEQDAAAARVLAGAADRDVNDLGGELRDFRLATAASFNAFRDDFVDLRTRVERGFAEMRGKFDEAAAGQQQIVELLRALSPDQDDHRPTR